MVEEAEAIYNESIVIDMRGMPSLTSEVGVSDFEASGVTMANIQGGSEAAMLLHNWYIDQFDNVALATSAKDVVDAKASGGMSVLMSMEHPEALSRACSDHRPVLKQHLVKLEQFYNLGLRRVQLTYNRRTMFADGSTERVDAGLSYYGVELIERMNELGMLVDCGHVGVKSSMDAVEVSKGPITYSHTGCRAVYDHPRSKTDEALKALAEKGGVAGIYNLPAFIRDRSRFPSQNSFFLDRATKYQPVRQMDYSHYSNEVNLIPPRYMPELAHTDYILTTTRGLLSRGYSRHEVKKIIGENFLRLTEKVLG